MKAFLSCGLLTLLTFMHCTQETVQPFTNAEQFGSALTSGTWRITSFIDSGKDQTSNFSGYNFTFNSSGILTAVRDNSTITGSWDTENDDDDLKLYLAFLSPRIFEDLTEDWRITAESTEAKLVLEHLSGGNGGTDYLTLVKN